MPVDPRRVSEEDEQTKGGRAPASAGPDLVWVLTPFEQPAPRIVVGAVRASALGILDLGGDEATARAALDTVTSRTGGRFGVRVSARCPLERSDLPAVVHTIVVADPTLVFDWQSEIPTAGTSTAVAATTEETTRRVIAEVRSKDEARVALAAGVDGLVAKGCEAGGRVGNVGAYLLTQQLLELTDRPVWVMGGIGRHTAAAAVAAGAAGVVVDSQVALLDEARLPRTVRAAVEAMDGSETRVVAGHRIFNRPDLWVAGLNERTSEEDLASRLGAGDLTSQALPVGQDGALAARFAVRYGTVGRMVRGLREEIAEHVQAARRVEPLAPGHGVSTTAGTAYPVVQGPMTRVSDRPDFTRAVAEHGGLPFLALALLRGHEVRPLLEEAAGMLGDRPWGVGVLGFVPKELREEQLDAIHEVGPPFALIAGGRPAQAQTLEQAGIRTFLHVPAPGLLGRFLRDGARRFVFEGFECGGHVGPRSSFALWESQLEVLLAWGADGGLEELDLLFAGGIHDQRSAAMVAAMTGPLVEAGARVGVLMGTAYLFTEEVVAAGAIGPEFQAQALACDQTALLESGPGHVTRCAETPFVDLFEETRQDLTAKGVDSQQRWAELEGLNLGRLRLASKGLKRADGELVSVDRDEQRQDGMFMIGDVATMRSELGTVAELHEAVTAGATAWLADRAGDLRLDPASLDIGSWDPPRPQPVDVAIVGMACIMPGAENADAFWRNIVEGVNSITEVPRERWDPDIYFDPEWEHATASEREGSASKWGGFIPEVPFDALAYGIPPSSLAAIEPTQLLSLKVAADALADAGYAERSFARERTSVIFGAEGGTDQSTAHGFRALFPAYLGKVPAELEAWLPKISEDSFPGLLTNVIAGRVANRLDLRGKNLTVDAACASSLAALDAACIELASGGSDVVLAGGADLHNGVQDYLLFTSVHALSTNGQCRTFDAAADGISLGEGVACVVLKRVEDAERDGDRIYAVIRSVAASSDGRSLGLTAPRPEGQELALRRAYQQAGVDARDVGLVEAHGTGTVVGDRTELATLTDVFAAAGKQPATAAVGSVKSNIGHTKCAAGLAGLIKAAKAIYHGVLPPTLHVDQPNQGWDGESSPFYFLDAVRPWMDERRVAGVSAFGFGGTNFHAVLESHDDDLPDRTLDAWPAELFVFRGEPAAVDRALADLAQRLDVAIDQRLRDVAAAVAGQGRGPVQLAIVADDFDDLRTKLGRARQGQVAPGVYRAGDLLDGPGQVAFLFPGQGSQRPGMAGDLFASFAETRDLLRIGERWVDTMLPPAAFGKAGQEAQRQALTDTRVAQPALGLADLAHARVLGRFGVRPDMVAGHSYGELVALCVGGAFDERALLELSEARAKAILSEIQDDDPGGMVAVTASREQLQPVLDAGDMVIANENHPEQLVVAGPTPALDDVLQRLSDAGLPAKRLPVACAFHSPLVAGAAEVLASRLESVAVESPTVEVYSNLTAGPYPSDPDEVRELLAGQLAGGVRFVDQVRAMYESGARVFVEVGPGRVLTGCVERILVDSPHVAIATDRAGDSGIRSLLHALAQLAVAGVPVDVLELFEDRGVDAARWSHPTRAAGWRINGHLVRRADDGEVVPGALRPADSVPQVSFAPASASGTNGSAGGALPPAGQTAGGVPVDGPPADQVLAEYFRTAHQIIESGHTLLLNYLGVQPSAPPTAGYGPPSNSSPAVAGLPSLGSGQPGGPGAPANGNGRAEAAAAAEPAAGPVSVAEAMGTPEELLARLTTIVSTRTGYPEDVLDPDLDVEADLSIDSIKRLEILSELADQIGLSDNGALAELEHLVEQLAARKTLRGIVEFLFEHAPGAPGAAAEDAPLDHDEDEPADDRAEPAVAHRAAGNGDSAASAIPAAANRFAVALIDTALPDAAVTGAHTPRVRVTGGNSAAAALDRELVARGVDATRASATPDGVDGATLVVVTDLFDDIGIPELYARIRRLLLETTCDVLVTARLGGGLGIDPPPPPPTGSGDGSGDTGGGVVPTGAGVRGLVKTAALEFPDRNVRLVDLDPSVGVDQFAGILADEVQRGSGPVEVGWRDGRRRAPTVVLRSDLAGAVPGNGTAGLPLTRDSVVLLTGGARGITARMAVALAERSGCHLYLAGRSPWPEDEEDSRLAECADRMALRALLASAGEIPLKDVDPECDRILAAREIRRLGSELAAAGSTVTYRQLDVRDAVALTQLVDEIYERHGRLDGIVHGAGILDDHLIADKSPEAFARVFSTKVDAGRTLLQAVRRATVSGTYPAPVFVAFFGSIAGVCGNRGQVDYAAANDALDMMAAANRDLASRVVAIDWGPWSPDVGMVSDALARMFEASGMGLIEADDGVGVLLDEIAVAANGSPVPGRAHQSPVPQMIAARCSPELMAASFAGAGANGHGNSNGNGDHSG